MVEQCLLRVNNLRDTSSRTIPINEQEKGLILVGMGDKVYMLLIPWQLDRPGYFALGPECSKVGKEKTYWAIW